MLNAFSVMLVLKKLQQIIFRAFQLCLEGIG